MRSYSNSYALWRRQVGLRQKLCPKVADSLECTPPWSSHFTAWSHGLLLLFMVITPTWSSHFTAWSHYLLVKVIAPPWSSDFTAQTRVWNDIPYTVLDTGTLDGFKGAVNRWLLPWVCFSVFVVQVLVGLHKQFMNNFIFPIWACAAGFNNNNNNDGHWAYPTAKSRRLPRRCNLAVYIFVFPEDNLVRLTGLWVNYFTCHA